MQVAKWGNSLAVRLPATLVKELGLQVGDELKLKQAVRQKGHVSELLVAKVPRSESSNLTEAKSNPLWINTPTFTKINSSDIEESNIKIKVKANLSDFDSNCSR